MKKASTTADEGTRWTHKDPWPARGGQSAEGQKASDSMDVQYVQSGI